MFSFRFNFFHFVAVLVARARVLVKVSTEVVRMVRHVGVGVFSAGQQPLFRQQTNVAQNGQSLVVAIFAEML
jgi:hypothetical protein